VRWQKYHCTGQCAGERNARKLQKEVFRRFTARRRGLDARTRAMIRNTSGSGLINKNSVADSTLTGLPFVSVLASKREEKNLQSI
jgi:hypothetical protein